MLWLHVKVGESVHVGDSAVKLIDKNKHGIVVMIDRATYNVPRDTWIEFPQFTLHAGCSSRRNLRLGFEAESHVKIRREKLETRLPTK